MGRSVVHLTLSHWITQFGVTEYDFLEVGASAGLNLNFDRFYGCYKQLRMGDAQSELRFMGDWFGNEPQVPKESARVIRRRGSDVSPINISNPDEEVRLLSFVWPDQKIRLQRLRTAIDIAHKYPPVIDEASADEWIEKQLGRGIERATMVFHSITWQYLGSVVQQRMKEMLSSYGQHATRDMPLFWARMEPAGAVADVQVTMWNGSTKPHEFRLAEVGYHGQNMNWL